MEKPNHELLIDMEIKEILRYCMSVPPPKITSEEYSRRFRDVDNQSNLNQILGRPSGDPSM